MNLRAALAPESRYGEFLRFSIVGVVGLFVDMAALTFAMHALNLGLYGGRLFSYLVAASTNWMLNRRFTFAAADQSPPIVQWLKFLGANAIGGLVNYAVYAGLVTFVPLAHDWPALGVCAGSIAGLAFNFTASKLWVFKR